MLMWFVVTHSLWLKTRDSMPVRIPQRGDFVMNSAIMFAIVAAVGAGSAQYARTHGPPKVRKPLMVTFWAVAIVAMGICVAVTFQ